MNKSKMLNRLLPVFAVVLAVSAGSVQSVYALDQVEGDSALAEKYTSLEACDQAIAADCNNFQAWVDRGVIHARMGLDEDAANDFDKATSVLDRQGADKVAHL
jgi:hypothetical protein